jgi:iron complex outermembrane receptor protein
LLSPGGVIGLLRDYRGTDLRWTHEGRLGELPFTVVGGLAWDGLEEHRRGWQNFVGETQGVTGAERRNERNDVIEFDQYLQTRWRLSPSWTLDAGVRRSRVGFTSKDRYIVGANPDDSGGATYHATLPALGLMYAASRALHLYAAAGRGFETPTLNELAYRPSGLTGPNFDLSPARSRSVELGAKLADAAWGAWNASVFATHTDDEIVVLTNSGGRTTYQNAGRTRRRGVELAWQQTYARHLGVQAAYTWLDATYADTFGTCTGSPCREPNLTIPAGRRLPGLARQSLHARVAWAPPEGWRLGAELQATGKVEVDDANSDAAAGYAVGAVHGGYQWRRGAWTLDAFGRVDNAFDRRYVGSVIVGEGNGRFFEPAPGRTWWAGVNLRREL